MIQQLRRTTCLLTVFTSWLIVLSLLLLTVLLVAGIDSTALVLLETAITYVYLPIYLAFAVAVLLRRRALAVTAALVAVCHLFFVFSGMPAATPITKAAQSTPHFSLYTHNVLYQNRTPEQIAGGIREINADVVMLQELTPFMLRTLRTNGVLDAYPYEAVAARNGAIGLGTFSKFPLTNQRMVDGAGFPQMVVSTTIEGRALTLVNVHAQAPVAGDPDIWKADLQSVDGVLEQGGLVVAAGDFNATWYHRPFRQLLDHGYTEAHIERGRGYIRTWPVGRRLGERVNGWIRIDHVLASPGLQFLNVTETAGQGSDHRGIVADVAVLPDSAIKRPSE